jgi:hypothetical protein
METLFTVIVMLALATPAQAATAARQDFPLIRDWQSNYWMCTRGIFPEDEKGHDPGEPQPERNKVCDTAVKLAKQLTVKGYCTFGRGGVGRPSKDRKHCYYIDNLPAD